MHVLLAKVTSHKLNYERRTSFKLLSYFENIPIVGGILAKVLSEKTAGIIKYSLDMLSWLTGKDV